MKQQRQSAIISIINNNAVETQEELLEKLIECGFNTTQATVSRDIRELSIGKVSDGRGRKKYAVLAKKTENHESYRQVLENSVLSIDAAENIIVIKTVSGMAMAVGAAVDSMKIDEIVGCIAGDDTLFLAIRHSSQVEEIMGDLKNVTKYAY